ncbi:MAG: hypothetical protein KBT11_08870 [Treponema sp.]|nr:hypothetical protein [Candidatus Treponema equifaecale]
MHRIFKNPLFLLPLIYISIALCGCPGQTKDEISIEAIYLDFLQTSDFEHLETDIQEFKKSRSFLVYKLQFPNVYDAIENLENYACKKDFENVYKNFSIVFDQLNQINSQSANIAFLFLFLISISMLLLIFTAALWQTKQREKMQIMNAMAETEKERSRISRELHDTIIQNLRALEWTCEKNDSFKEIAAELSKIQNSIRSICSDLNPPGIIFEDFDTVIIGLCSEFEKHSGIPCQCNLQDRGIFNFLDLKKRLNLYRILQEVLNNSHLHSECTKCSLLARKTSDCGFILYINDNGKGFDTSKIKFDRNSHFGLSGIKQRAMLINAKMEITSSQDDGTQVKLEM